MRMIYARKGRVRAFVVAALVAGGASVSLAPTACKSQKAASGPTPAEVRAPASMPDARAPAWAPAATPGSSASSRAATKEGFSISDGVLSFVHDGVKATIASGVDGFWPIAQAVSSRAGADGGERAAASIAYARADGAGGYENEGESLYLWALGYREGHKLLAEYFQIRGVDALLARSGKAVLLVTMMDGGLGATHLAFADPERGEVFRVDGAEVVGRGDGWVRIGWFRDEDWEALAQDSGVRPKRTELFELDRLLKRSATRTPQPP